MINRLLGSIGYIKVVNGTNLKKYEFTMERSTPNAAANKMITITSEDVSFVFL